uniref:Uncharacterized protein n=1 Tax=viral metagenome TaxID=1070528 RepID=A0A6M3IDS2_9ZZZZ
MTPGDRFKKWVDDFAMSVKDRLRGWFLRALSEGAERLLDDLEPELVGQVKAQINEVLENPALPPLSRELLEKVVAPKSFAFVPILIAIAISAAIQPIMAAIMPWIKSIGFASDTAAVSARLDPMSVVTAWRRDPVKYAPLFGDLRDLGWSEDRIEALKFITLFIPTADEQTHWLAREVFEPEMVARYGLDSELPNYEETDFSKIGVTPEQMANKWAAHWEHASYMQIREMLRRGVLSLDKTMPSPPTTRAGWDARDAEGYKAMYDWYRLVEIPPFWRDRLTEMAFEVPTRVDVRRFWDMRTIDEERLRSIYHSQGYHGKDLDDYILWTKVYVAFPDLIARYKNGWITEDDVKSELASLGMSTERLEEMWQTKFKTAQPERVAAEKTATATEIMKAVKKGYISWSDGIDRLARMGYSESEADFKLTVYVGVVEGSPETYIEFVDWTERYRKTIGLEAHIPSPELVESGKAIRQAKADLADAELEGVKGEKLAPYLKAVSDAEYRYRQLLIAWEEGKTKK